MSFITLDGIGMSGCVLNVDPAAMIVLPATTDTAGRAVMPLPLPDNPLVTGDLFFQWIHVAPGANQLGVQATQGLKSQVR